VACGAAAVILAWLLLQSIELHPVGPVLAGIVAYPMEKAKDALRLFRDRGIETVGFRPAMLARDGDAVRMDHIGFEPCAHSLVFKAGRGRRSPRA